MPYNTPKDRRCRIDNNSNSKSCYSKLVKRISKVTVSRMMSYVVIVMFAVGVPIITLLDDHPTAVSKNDVRNI